MKFALLVLLAVFLAFSHTSSPAQIFRTPTPTPKPSPSPTPTPEPRPVPCPNVSVQAQGGQTVRDGQTVRFVANIAGGDPRAQPTILWNINAGTIKQGQNTRSVEVDTTGAGTAFDRELKAEVWV